MGWCIGRIKLFAQRSVPGAIATGLFPRSSSRTVATRSLSLPVLTSTNLSLWQQRPINHMQNSLLASLLSLLARWWFQRVRKAQTNPPARRLDSSASTDRRDIVIILEKDAGLRRVQGDEPVSLDEIDQST